MRSKFYYHIEHPPKFPSMYFVFQRKAAKPLSLSIPVKLQVHRWKFWRVKVLLPKIFALALGFLDKALQFF